MELSFINETVQKVAEAITSALEIETEIVDSSLLIVGGTGRYMKKIGTYEEEGNLNSPYIYSQLLKTGAEYACIDSQRDPTYDPKEGELAEICCPIRLKDKIIGLIGLVAFTKEQQNRIAVHQQSLLQFLRIMSDLISSKLAMASHNDFMKIALDSILSTEASVTSFSSIKGTSHSLHSVLKRAMQVAPSDSTVLITGESGTGKELFARSIHQASPRKDKPFVSINCGAIPEMLLESELFGYEKGAFTGASHQGKLGKFEIAEGGTIFLDEIGDMPLHLQVKLLSALQNRQIDRIGGISPVNINVRIIAATNKNLEEAIQSREFREDLFYRLNVIPLFIPPLRERPEDIPPLLAFILNKFTSKLNKSIYGLSEEAGTLLLRYPWPGNVRELENTMEFAVTLEPSDHITVDSLPDRIRKWSSNLLINTGSLKERLDHCQRSILQEVLLATGSSLAGKREAAEILKISESTLYRRLRELEIE